MLLTTSITHWARREERGTAVWPARLGWAESYLTSLFSAGPSQSWGRLWVLIYLSHFGGQSTAATSLIATPQVEFLDEPHCAGEDWRGLRSGDHPASQQPTLWLWGGRGPGRGGAIRPILTTIKVSWPGQAIARHSHCQPHSPSDQYQSVDSGQWAVLLVDWCIGWPKRSHWAE